MIRISLIAALIAVPLHAQPPKSNAKLDPALAKTAGESVDKAIAFFRTQQGEDGNLAPNSPFGMGISAIAISGMLGSKRITADDPLIAKAMAFMEKQVQPDGGIYPKQLAAQQNYLTAVGLIAFVAADKDGKYKSVRDNAVRFLKGVQWSNERDDVGKVDEKDSRFGGFGYGATSRPDLSNTAYTIDALVAAGLTKDDPAVQKAMVFLRRCQNFTGEGGNDKLPADAKNLDGGFVYMAADPAAAKKKKGPDGGMSSYGSMTYSGFKSFVYAGLSKDDPRVKAALAWISKHYSVTENPGQGLAGLFYYYQVFAKALKAFDAETVAVDGGQKRDWRADLIKELVSKQRENGSWVNTNRQFLENDARLATAFALDALAHAMK